MDKEQGTTRKNFGLNDTFDVVFYKNSHCGAVLSKMTQRTCRRPIHISTSMPPIPDSISIVPWGVGHALVPPRGLSVRWGRASAALP